MRGLITILIVGLFGCAGRPPAPQNQPVFFDLGLDSPDLEGVATQLTQSLARTDLQSGSAISLGQLSGDGGGLRDQLAASLRKNDLLSDKQGRYLLQGTLKKSVQEIAERRYTFYRVDLQLVERETGLMAWSDSAQVQKATTLQSLR